MKHIWILILIVSCLGCQSQNDPTTEFKDTAMTMQYKIVIGSQLSYSEKSSVKKIIKQTFDQVDTHFNKWNPQSELSRLNQLNGKTRVFISAELEQFIYQIDNIVSLCEKRFDPTIEPVQKVWKQKLAEGKTPETFEIESLASVVGWDKIHIESGLFWKDDTRCALDFGGIAKGYTVDLLVERLNQAGYNNVFVEWGGEIRATGKHPEGRPWSVFISRFDDSNPENALGFVDLNNQAIATSGDYLQNWTVKNKEESKEWTTYFHIFDIQKHTPLVANHESIASVTVLAPTCALADALATTTMTFPNIVTAQKWAEKIQKDDPTITFWIVSRKSLDKNNH